MERGGHAELKSTSCEVMRCVEDMASVLWTRKANGACRLHGLVQAWPDEAVHEGKVCVCAQLDPCITVICSARHLDTCKGAASHSAPGGCSLCSAPACIELPPGDACMRPETAVKC